MEISKDEELFRLINTNGTKFVDYLEKVKEISDINYTDNLFHRSYLHVAVQNNREDIFKDLLERGIDTNIQDKNKNTAASYLATEKKWHLLKELSKYGLNPNVKQRLGNNVLWNVIFYTTIGDSEAYEVIKILLDIGVDATAENEQGNTPLLLATRKKDKVIVEMLEGHIELKN
jgi:hypothetical protein